MHFFTKTLLFFTFFVFCHKLFSQEQLGLRLSNYSGINGVILNPAAGVNNPLGWDVNIFSLGSFVANDFAFFRDASLLSLYRNRYALGLAPETKITYPRKANKYLDFFNQPHEKYFSTTNFLDLPSFQVNLESGHSFGVFTRQRLAIGTRQIPIIADPYVQQGILLGWVNKIPPMFITGMTWGELGFNYAYQFGDAIDGGLSIGATVKVLRGNQGFFFENREGTSVTRLTKDSTRINELNISAGLTKNIIGNVLANNGSGLGIDVAAQFIVGSGESDDRPYLFKVNAALLDLGRINFTRNTDVYALKFTEPLLIETKDYANLDPSDPEGDILQRINKKTNGKTDNTLQGHYFPMGLPTAFSLQGDVAVAENIFVNGLLIQRLRFNDLILSRDNLFAITPRFESHWFDASLPLSILNYEQVQIGLAARVAFFTLGTDNLMSYLGQKRLTGSDFYMALKINSFSIGKLGNGRGFNSGIKSRKSVKCYRF